MRQLSISLFSSSKPIVSLINSKEIDCECVRFDWILAYIKIIHEIKQIMSTLCWKINHTDTDN